MSNHLSEEQFAECIVNSRKGRPASAELQHINECPECSAELERFGNTLSQFRSSVRHRIDERLASHPNMPPLKPAGAGISTWRLTWVGAAVVALVIPFLINETKPRTPGVETVVIQAPAVPASADTNPEAVMKRVNLHLSRTVPAPMEPMMGLIPSEERITKSGGVQ